MPLTLNSDQLITLGMDPAAADAFLRLHRQYLEGPSRLEDWETLKSPDPDHLPAYENLNTPVSRDRAQDLARLVVLKLNGGLGTGMGCTGPKSAIPVKQGKTFLDLIVEQMKYLQGTAAVPLVLMNSFYTHRETQNLLSRYSSQVPIFTFQQNRFPRLNAESGGPLDPERFGEEAWYPPGHGDLYTCLHEQGWLDRWLKEGREVLFVSNADNLGAVVDPGILHFILQRDIPFLMEMTRKTPADVKGGTLYQKNDRLHLLELAHVPEEHVASFQGMDKFRVFNTNNIWIHLSQLKKRLQKGPLDLGVIVNPKEVCGQSTIQLETAVGAGLENFSRSVGLVVPRTRFAPVKTTSDLLLIQSDLYVEQEGRMVRNPERIRPGFPQVHLGDTFKTLEDYHRRLPVIPSLLALESLSIEGDVVFEGPSTLKGWVSLHSKEKPIRIPSGTILEDEEQCG